MAAEVERRREAPRHRTIAATQRRRDCKRVRSADGCDRGLKKQFMICGLGFEVAQMPER